MPFLDEGDEIFSKPDEPYATESMFRFMVDKEKSGFDQCRNRVMGWLDQRINDLGKPPYYMEYESGQEAAYKDVLEYLKGAERANESPPAGPELPV